MEFKDLAEEVKHLQRCMNDLVSVHALPAIWNGSGADHILATFLDALSAMLGVNFLYSRVALELDKAPVEAIRLSQTPEAAHNAGEIRSFLNYRFGEDARHWPAETRTRLGDKEVSIVSMRLGLEGEIGIVIAGSQRLDFPRQTEKLILSTAANQLVVGLQQARLLNEQKRIADELERRVTERTTRLAAANEELKKEIAERKIIENHLLESEKQLKTSEAKLRQVIDTIPSLSWCNLPDGPNEFLNKGWHDYTGLSHEEAHGWGWQAAFHPDDLPVLMKKWQDLLASGESGEMEARLRRNDGVYRWFLIRVAPFRDETGTILRWYGTSTDIHDRKLTDEALRASENNLRQIVNSIPGLVCTMDPSGGIEQLNRPLLEYFGKTPGELKNWKMTDAVHPDDLPKVVEAYTHSIATGTPYEIEHRCRRADGVYRWFQVRASAVRNAHGDITGWYVLLTDIDDRKRAEEAVLASERGLGLIINTIPVLAWSARRDGNADFFSRRWLEYTGLTQSEARDWGWANAFHPDDLDRVNDHWRSHVLSGEPCEIEARLRRFDGSYRWFLLRANPLRDELGAIVTWYGTNTDIDARKQAEEALTIARAELAHVTRITSLGMLTASIAHEVNQPLSGIVTNASTCMRMLDSDPPNIDGARETVRRTIRDGNRASEVVTRLRALFRKRDVATESVDLCEAAREVIAMSVIELQGNRVTLKDELTDSLPHVQGDRIQLQQVILNLLRNASDAMTNIDDRPRELLVRTEREGNDAIRFSVKDAGAGFDPEFAEKLFEGFYTTKSNGMGIGLSVSRSIIEAHQGRLWATLNDGPGATFAFSIPCVGAMAREGIDDMPFAENSV
jgi:PAS domain S-box-containing protein